jgi:cation:H+ antiporter
VGITVTIASLTKRRRFEMSAEPASIRRDLTFFLVMYSLAIVLPLSLGKGILVPTAVALVAGYLFYAYKTFRGESAGLEHFEELYLWRMARKMRPSRPSQSPPLPLVVIQVLTALAVMIEGAHLFVESLGYISLRFGMNPLLFSLLLAPFATELPEKFNSVTWTWKGRDTLAVGNITGAMVFQSTFPVSVGLLFTRWDITGMALLSAVFAVVSALALLGVIVLRKRVSPVVMLFSGSLYLLYALVLILRK